MNTIDMQRVLKGSLLAIMLLSAFLAVKILDTLKSLRDVSPVYNSISVTGEGEVFAIPDVATFSFTVSADAKTVGDAQKSVTDKMNAILDGLKAMGVEDKDIKTTDYSVWPKYTYDQTLCSPTYCPPARQIQDGYTANHTVLVKVRKTESAGDALALAGDKGATGLSGINFTIDDPNIIREEARSKAIADAKDKAKKLSDELGVRLVRVVSFYDNTGGGPVPYYGEALGMGGDNMIKSTPAPTIPTGENKVAVNVTVTFEIR